MPQDSNLDRKLKNFHNIKNLVNVYFTQTLSEYQLLNSKINSNLAEVANLQKLYDALDQKYQIKSFFFDNYQKQKNKDKTKTLIIYFAESARFSALSFKALDEKMLATYKNGDYLITIGDHAYQFCQQEALNVAKNYPQLSLGLAQELKLYAYKLFITNTVAKVKVIMLSNRWSENEATILPVSEYQARQKGLSVDLANLLIYPSLSEFINYLNLIFLDLAFKNITIEASFFNLKQKIARLKSLLENIEDKISETKSAILKDKRRIMTEEIISTTQN